MNRHPTGNTLLSIIDGALNTLADRENNLNQRRNFAYRHNAYINLNEIESHGDPFDVIDAIIQAYISRFAAPTNQQVQRPKEINRTLAQITAAIGPYNKMKRESNDECLICLDHFKKNQGYRKLKCGHLFHKKCIDKWFTKNSTCPTCRTDVFHVSLPVSPLA